MKKKIIAVVSMVMMASIPVFASSFNLILWYNDEDRTAEYFSFDWDAGGSGNNPWHGPYATVVKKHNKECVVTASSQKSIRYDIGYAMKVPQSGSLYTNFIYRKGTGN